ncbi:DNA mismatch repair protein MutT [Enterococcus sp. JM4C]|uniref:NUDIX domain-containing protein n=1 Tax=Candidatus Enterococcus huntleyi TaxID=1857217 RepID=UPI0013796C97|nr:NUDIX domain-containing protein [Enterococcus sp. JM4C]KAF1299483.1 DNA mismatch repair protein MutT [Enterococcus sp. JM4C]
MELIEGLAKLKSLVNTSLAYVRDVYDEERLVEMQAVLRELTETYATNLTEKEIERYFSSDVGYVTPKVDVRAVVFNPAGDLLLVQEKSDGTWALPGGWADIGYSPGEIAQKETMEEAGISVTPKHLIKVIDKAKHDYPESLEYVYKFFIYCEADSFEIATGVETSAVAFYAREELTKTFNLSIERNTFEDIADVFDYFDNRQEMTKFD